MTTKGQLTVPKDVRDRLNLSPGTRFYVTERNGQVVAVPKNKKLADLVGMLGTPPNGRSVTVDEMNEAIMDAAGQDDERIMKEWSEQHK